MHLSALWSRVAVEVSLLHMVVQINCTAYVVRTPSTDVQQCVFTVSSRFFLSPAANFTVPRSTTDRRLAVGGK